MKLGVISGHITKGATLGALVSPVVCGITWYLFTLGARDASIYYGGLGEFIYGAFWGLIVGAVLGSIVGLVVGLTKAIVQ